MIPFDDALRARLAGNLVRHPRLTIDAGGRRRAAVALTVVPGEHGAAFWLCLRPSRLSEHAGQFALPGGRLDPGETAVHAALRELDEELGVRLAEDQVLGMLDDYPTRSGYVITPVVVWGGNAPVPSPSAHEVEVLFAIGLEQLTRDDSPVFVAIPESDRPVVQLPTDVATLHAPTAAVLLQFRCVGLDGHVGLRVDHLEQPVFAWR